MRAADLHCSRDEGQDQSEEVPHLIPDMSVVLPKDRDVEIEEGVTTELSKYNCFTE
jgi:hypothetical protein